VIKAGFGVTAGPHIAAGPVMPAKKVPRECADQGEQQTQGETCRINCHITSLSVTGTCYFGSLHIYYRSAKFIQA
jgi:hypothetical protein